MYQNSKGSAVAVCKLMKTFLFLKRSESSKENSFPDRVRLHIGQIGLPSGIRPN